MSSPQNLKLTRAVKTLLDLIFGLLVIASVFLILWIAASPVITRVSDIVITASVPVAIGSGDEPIEVEVAGSAAEGIQAAFVDDAQGTLKLETTNLSFIIVSNLAKHLTAIGLAYVVYLLRSVLEAILQGNTFAPENAVLIRRMGYMVLLVGFLRPTVEYLSARVILNQLTIVQPVLSLPSLFNVEVILASLLILVLAQVWSYGLELERDQMLTV